MAAKTALNVTGAVEVVAIVKLLPNAACSLPRPKKTITAMPANTKSKIAVLSPAPDFTPFVLIKERKMMRKMAVSFTLRSAKGKNTPPDGEIGYKAREWWQGQDAVERLRKNISQGRNGRCLDDRELRPPKDKGKEAVVNFFVVGVFTARFCQKTCHLRMA